MTVNPISPPELKTRLDNGDKLVLLDVRELVEYNYARIEGSMLIPLNEIPARLTEIEVDQDVVTICHHGIRSMQAANFLNQVGFKKVSNLTGGIDAWSLECDNTVARY